MNRAELTELFRNGESSGVEFKRDAITPVELAGEMAAFLNLEGGYILLGIEEDGGVSGLARGREKAEKWGMEAARTHLQPAAIPYHRLPKARNFHEKRTNFTKLDTKTTYNTR